ncbi:E1 [Leptonychotes weddellii papillomavirus 2]|uniref:Replication protein E1 n=1 Tax=Leptonychotes weddellii papillomavirus 2 TaxID=2077303 RepID=A0A2I8B2N7_9PAPI|nr:E1 [Leptonychotes weddellii papillomavirus 2]AUT11891.1 E1 [Leptonychotes weddellii papillomavirus 2]
MADNKGTEDSLGECSGDWYIVKESECDGGSADEIDDLFECSTIATDLSGFIDDNDEVDCLGNPQALLNRQLLEETTEQLEILKRKYTSPSPCKNSVDVDISPQLSAVCISPAKKQSKRRLFEDSGIGNETPNSSESPQVDELENGGTRQAPPVEAAPGACGDGGYEKILQSSNRRAAMLCKFKEEFNVSYTELTRHYKSDKTCNTSWVVVGFGVPAELSEASKTLLPNYCDYVQLIKMGFGPVNMVLYLLECKTGKSRETLVKMLCTMLNVKPEQLLCDPPKTRSTPVALFWYKKSMSNASFVSGAYPDWLASLTLLSHQTASETFELCQMVQWAYDNHFTEESEIAFNYAKIAEEEPNAAAWLKSNSQYKHVRDCANMVKLYIRQQMKEMTMTQWIRHCSSKVTGEGDWTVVQRFLKYQGVNVLSFLGALRAMLKGIPKKSCIVIHGPPDTGKSHFCYGLVSFLQGRVISYHNAKSHFWLQPLIDCKVGFLDDATDACWVYIDTYMRSGLDGNTVSVDSKHKAPLQIKLPPLLVTTNVDVGADPNYKFLHSRLTCFKFPNPLPIENGEPVYVFSDTVWKALFVKLRRQLGLDEEEEESDGDPERAPCFLARNTVRTL